MLPKTKVSISKKNLLINKTEEQSEDLSFKTAKLKEVVSILMCRDHRDKQVSATSATILFIYTY